MVTTLPLVAVPVMPLAPVVAVAAEAATPSRDWRSQPDLIGGNKGQPLSAQTCTVRDFYYNTNKGDVYRVSSSTDDPNGFDVNNLGPFLTRNLGINRSELKAHNLIDATGSGYAYDIAVSKDLETPDGEPLNLLYAISARGYLRVVNMQYFEDIASGKTSFTKEGAAANTWDFILSEPSKPTKPYPNGFNSLSVLTDGTIVAGGYSNASVWTFRPPWVKKGSDFQTPQQMWDSYKKNPPSEASAPVIPMTQSFPGDDALSLDGVKYAGDFYEDPDGNLVALAESGSGNNLETRFMMLKRTPESLENFRAAKKDPSVAKEPVYDEIVSVGKVVLSRDNASGTNPRIFGMTLTGGLPVLSASDGSTFVPDPTYTEGPHTPVLLYMGKRTNSNTEYKFKPEPKYVPGAGAGNSLIFWGAGSITEGIPECLPDTSDPALNTFEFPKTPVANPDKLTEEEIAQVRKNVELGYNETRGKYPNIPPFSDIEITVGTDGTVDAKVKESADPEGAFAKGHYVPNRVVYKRLEIPPRRTVDKHTDLSDAEKRTSKKPSRTKTPAWAATPPSTSAVTGKSPSNSPRIPFTCPRNSRTARLSPE